MRFKSEDFKLLELSNGLTIIAEDDTTPLSRLADYVNGIPGVRRYRDFITGEHVYDADENDEDLTDEIIATVKDSITREEALKKLHQMTEEERILYVSKVTEEKKEAYERYKAKKESRKKIDNNIKRKR